MSVKKKYLLINSAMILVFFYLTGEVLNRWDSVIQTYRELRQKEETVLSPENLAQKRLNLTARKKMLASVLTKDAGTFEQSQTGVIEFLNTSAKATAVRFESLVPGESPSTGLIRVIPFKITFFTNYHRVGAFLNTIETGTMNVRMKKLEITSPKESSFLHVMADGIAYILPKSLR